LALCGYGRDCGFHGSLFRKDAIRKVYLCGESKSIAVLPYIPMTYVWSSKFTEKVKSAGLKTVVT